MAHLAGSTVLAVVVLALSQSTLAHAQAGVPPVPTCATGHDTRAASDARREGLGHYRAAKTGTEERAATEMTAALGFFDAECAAGDDFALELRAYALAGLGRFVEAASSLDAFLEKHPLDSLPDDVRSRISAEQPQILDHVATLAIASKPEGLAVALNHRALGTTPMPKLRLEPATYDLQLTAPNGTPSVRTITLAVGPHAETFDFASAAPGQVSAPSTRDVAHPPSKHTLRPYAYASAGVAGVGLVLGIVGAVWQANSAATYNASCLTTPPLPGCTGTANDFQLASGLEVGGFIGAGVFAVVAVVLWVLEPHGPPPPKRNFWDAGRCTFGRCAFSF